MNMPRQFAIWLSAIICLYPITPFAKVYICSSADVALYDFARSQTGPAKRFGTNLSEIGLSQSGILYGVRGNQFYRVNTSTGKAARVGPALPISGTVLALAIDAHGYAVAASTANAGFYVINLANWQVANVTNGGYPALSTGDLVFDGDNLYFSFHQYLIQYTVVRDSNNKIVSFRKTGNPVVLKIRRNGRWSSFNGINGLAVPQKGSLIGFSGDEIYQIDAANGQITLAGTQSAFQTVVGAASTPDNR